MIRKIIWCWSLMAILSLSALTLSAQEPNARVNAMSSVLNLRSAPNTSASIVAELAGNTPLIASARTSNNRWYQVQTLEGQAGWVSASFVTLNVSRNSLPVQNTSAPADAPQALADNASRASVPLSSSTNFAKVGDSITYSEMFLQPIGAGTYQLGAYENLRPVINFFLQGDNSFIRTSLASGNGWTTETVLKSEFANPQMCLSGESPLLCEYRLTSPSVALIMLGSNDVASVPGDVYAHNLALITRLSLEQGVLPILSTIPYRVGYEQQVEAFNQTVRNVADLYGVPVWDYFGAMLALPNAGLSDDGLHPSIPNGGFARVADFTGDALNSGYTLRNLTALQALQNALNRLR